ncbi:MAG: cytochrome c3 family protein [Coriobacteriales bacterium]|jgi:hypothetical protein|nr:cytochrome c3 family protein [Coriobacteriales bacterium]
MSEDLDEKSTPKKKAQDAGTAPDDTGVPSLIVEDKPKKKRSKVKIVILSVVIVFVVLLGAGFGGYTVFHSNPAFCNFICHTPMDPYVASYVDGISVRPNQQGKALAGLGVVVHRDSDQNVNCLTCHDASLEEQIREGIAWVTGDYSVPLYKSEDHISLVTNEATAPNERMGAEFCLREGCHSVTTVEELKASTASQVRNPHDCPHTTYDCGSCHNMHEQSVMQCASCHDNAKVPDGWLKKAPSATEP